MSYALSMKFMDLICRMHYTDKKIHIYGLDNALYSSELHAISIVGDMPGICGTHIAQRLGITKSASSQILKKLQNKKLICKQVSSEKMTKLSWTLTEAGERVYEYHKMLHRDFDSRFDRLLQRHSAEERAFLETFLKELNQELDLYEKSWSE